MVENANAGAKQSMSARHTTPTLDDVAQLAQVSTATVSRCLNAPDRVSKDTRQRVMQAVDRLGYTPNFGARVMAAKRTYTIGAIIPTMENAIFARGLQAFQEALHARGYTLLVSSTSYSPEVEAEQVRALVARGADGLLLIGHERDPAIYQYMAQQNVPALVAWAYSEREAQPSIGFDNRAAMRGLAEQVLDLGHVRIGVVSAVSQGNDRATQRLLGIKEALSARGMKAENLNVIETPYGIENGRTAFEQLMALDRRPSVVMCGNDVLAAGAMQGARAMRLKVPEDVSVTGFDDIELAQIVTPSLTTVHVPHRDMGHKAAEELVRLVETGQPGPSVELPVTLQRRQSLGPA